MHRKIFPTVFLVLMALAAGSWYARPVAAQEDSFANQVQKTLEESISLGQQAGRERDDWAGEKQKLLARLQELRDRQTALKEKKQALALAVSQKEKQVVELRKQEENYAAFSQSLLPFLIRTVENLKTLEDSGPPEARQKRLDGLRELEGRLSGDQLTLGEKYARVLDAVFAALQSADGVKTDQGRISVNGNDTLVDILRVGRLSVFFQTLDRQTTGFWDPAASDWKVLDPKFGRPVRQAMDMADRQRAADIVNLPLGRLAAP